MKKRGDTCFYTSFVKVLLGLCEKQNVHYFIQDQSRGVLLHSRNDNPSTPFLITGSSFSTCLKSALLHTSISANVNSQESHLPVSCHNHQTTHEGFLPVRGVLIWPWKHGPVATGSSLDEVTLVTESQRNIHNEENYTVSLWLNLVGRSGIYWPYTQQLGKKHFLCCCKWSNHDTGSARGKNLR